MSTSVMSDPALNNESCTTPFVLDLTKESHQLINSYLNQIVKEKSNKRKIMNKMLNGELNSRDGTELMTQNKEMHDNLIKGLSIVLNYY